MRSGDLRSEPDELFIENVLWSMRAWAIGLCGRGASAIARLIRRDRARRDGAKPAATRRRFL